MKLSAASAARWNSPTWSRIASAGDLTCDNALRWASTASPSPRTKVRTLSWISAKPDDGGSLASKRAVAWTPLAAPSSRSVVALLAFGCAARDADPAVADLEGSPFAFGAVCAAPAGGGLGFVRDREAACGVPADGLEASDEVFALGLADDAAGDVLAGAAGGLEDAAGDAPETFAERLPEPVRFTDSDRPDAFFEAFAAGMDLVSPAFDAGAVRAGLAFLPLRGTEPLPSASALVFEFAAGETGPALADRPASAAFAPGSASPGGAEAEAGDRALAGPDAAAGPAEFAASFVASFAASFAASLAADFAPEGSGAVLRGSSAAAFLEARLFAEASAAASVVADSAARLAAGASFGGSSRFGGVACFASVCFASVCFASVGVGMSIRLLVV